MKNYLPFIKRLPLQTYIQKLTALPLAGRHVERAYRLFNATPRVINIELTSKCNARCLYCGREALLAEGTRRIRDMAPELLARIVADIRRLPHPPERLVPVGLGEPFLQKAFPEALTLIRDQLPDQFIQMTTNGIFFPEHLQNLLIDLSIDKLIISINFHSADLYRHYNGVDQFKAVIQQAEAFLKRKGRRKPDVTVQVLDIKKNEADLQDFRAYWRARLNANDRILIRPFNDFGGTVEVDQFIDPPTVTRRYPCSQIFDHLMINVDGYAFPCCMGITAANDSDLCIGNLNTHSIPDLYAPGAQVHTIRRMHRHNQYTQLTKCNGCDTWSFDANLFFLKGNRWQ